MSDAVCDEVTVPIEEVRPMNEQTAAVFESLRVFGPDQGAVRASVLLAALSDLGAKEEPPGSNAGPEIYHLVRGISDYWWSDLDAPDWCAASVSQWIRRGLGLPNWRLTRTKPFAPSIDGHPWGQFYVGVKQIFDWAQSVEDSTPGVWLTKPEPGAVFLICSERDGRTVYEHTGIVLSVDEEAGTLTTIEGNWSSAVTSRTLSISYPRYFVAWWAVL